ncbi:MAG: F0F1 ATP synthase subunit delta [Chloroflexota bacterium]
MPRTNARATRYASAAFAVALDDNQLDEWAGVLDRAAAFFDDPVAARMLTRPTVTAEQKRQALAQALPDAPPKVQNFLGVVAQHDRVGLLPDIAYAFRRLVNEHRGISVATVTTAVPINDQERQAIASRLSQRVGKQVAIESRVDPRILGGVVAQIDDDIIDGSVRGRLERLRRTLLA